MTERARLEQAKSEFVATASHELRSPLTSIKGFVELLAASDLHDRQREFIEIILLSTNRLVELVNDLLDVARVEAGQLEIQRRPISVAEAVREVATLMAPRFDERDQTLDVEIAPALPAAYADPARVRQIVTNLLTNAHLYTPEGGRVTVSVGAAGEDLVLSVADTGRGMTPEQLERVFDRFYRAETSGPGGSGLGLSIVRSLVELHEGSDRHELRARPRHHRHRPAPAHARRRGPARAAPGDPRPPRPRDRGRAGDRRADRRAAAPARGRRHHRPRRRRGACARCHDDRFDAVTLDILLGGMDGFEVLRAIRDDPELRRTPVIVVSVMAGQETLAAEWSVTKPIDAEELTDAIGSAILASRARVLVVGRSGMREVVGPLLERRGIEFEWATSGAEAARMCEETHYEVALVDAGMRAPQAALAQLDLRGRRLRRSVVVFSAGELAPGLARLDPNPVPVEDATAAVVEALRTSTGVETGQ